MRAVKHCREQLKVLTLLHFLIYQFKCDLFILHAVTKQSERKNLMAMEFLKKSGLLPSVHRPKFLPEKLMKSKDIYLFF